MGTIKPGYNDLLTWCTNNGARGQLLIYEWNQDKNYNEYGMPIVMQEISYSHHRTKYWWKCKKCGNDFQMSPASRTVNEQGCPTCGHKAAGVKNHRNALNNGNDLYSWCKKNGTYGKHIIKEWDTRRNMDLLGTRIADVSYGSGKKVYWICSRCGEKFQCSVGHRILCRTGCNNCNNRATSFPEQVIYMSLKQIYPDTLSREKAFGKIEYDICVPSKRLCIEYSGAFWHKDKTERDTLKRKICVENNVRFIEIIACNDGVEWDICNDVIRYRIIYSKQVSQLYSIVKYIVESLGNSMLEIDFDKAVERANVVMFDKVENNIKDTYPQLCKEWDYDNNTNLKPEYFTGGSKKEIYWKCYKCGRSRKVSIKSRIAFKSGCPYCGYNIFDNKIHKSAINKKKEIKPFDYSL